MQKVAILGVGLMGGSLGMALKNVYKNKEREYFILGIGRKIKNLKIAKQKGAVDEFSTNIEDIKNSDIVVICYPVDMIVDTYKRVAKIVSKKTIIIDIGSIKSDIEQSINNLIKRNKEFPKFIGCHPMAGMENNGIQYVKKDLYKKTNVIITGNKNSLISKMWKDVGCNLIFISAKKHDEIVAFTSHLPHIIAFNFFRMFKQKNSKNKQIQNMVGGSFNSITRVSKSSSQMWAPIFLGNKNNLQKLTKEFCNQIGKFSRTFNNEKNLKKLLNKSINNEN
ncbi:MAG: prephenate dehydrogenase/arogenate dehydrogenase family protein [Endomicrobiaceae bacterium]|nr:prephenate dehydrogenase/arogenate dehydrogenase family protein [Endomicrobiaceae bacterium]